MSDAIAADGAAPVEAPGADEAAGADDAVDPPPVQAARKAAEADIVPAHKKPRRLNGA